MSKGLNQEIKRYVDSSFEDYGNRPDWYEMISDFLNYIVAGETPERAMELAHEEWDYTKT